MSSFPPAYKSPKATGSPSISGMPASRICRGRGPVGEFTWKMPIPSPFSSNSELHRRSAAWNCVSIRPKRASFSRRGLKTCTHWLAKLVGSVENEMHEDAVPLAEVVVQADEVGVLRDRLVDGHLVGVVQGIGLQELGVRHVLQQVLRARVETRLWNDVVGERQSVQLVVNQDRRA